MNNNLLSSNIEENSNQLKDIQIIYLYYFFPKIYQNLGIGFITLLMFLFKLDFYKLNMLSVISYSISQSFFHFLHRFLCFNLLQKNPSIFASYSNFAYYNAHLSSYSQHYTRSYNNSICVFIPYISTWIVSAIISALLYYTDLRYLRLKVYLPLLIGIIVLMVFFYFICKKKLLVASSEVNA